MSDYLVDIKNNENVTKYIPLLNGSKLVVVPKGWARGIPLKLLPMGHIMLDVKVGMLEIVEAIVDNKQQLKDESRKVLFNENYNKEMNLTQKAGPPPHTGNPGQLYFDLQARKMYMFMPSTNRFEEFPYEWNPEEKKEERFKKVNEIRKLYFRVPK